MEWLKLDLLASQNVYAAAALLQGMTRLEFSKARSSWLQEWVKTPAIKCAFPQLQQLVVRTVTSVDESVPTVTDMLPLLQSMAEQPLELLHITLGEPVTCGVAAMIRLSRLQQLRELDVQCAYLRYEEDTAMDWSDQVSFASFTPNCLPYLHSVALRNVKLSAESVVAIAFCRSSAAHVALDPHRSPVPSRRHLRHHRRLLPARRGGEHRGAIPR